MVIGRWRRWSSATESRLVLSASSAWNRPSSFPGGTDDAFERLLRITAVPLCIGHGVGDIGDGAFHDRVEQRLACREVDVDRRADDTGLASDLGHAGAHCHIAEHHESGMMFSFGVAPARGD